MCVCVCDVAVLVMANLVLVQILAFLGPRTDEDDAKPQKKVTKVLFNCVIFTHQSPPTLTVVVYNHPC